ncbi:phosphoribosyltransferase [Williamsoniiplasma lucivorax]|uniref:Hypoxanthine-guanine phosphoribosyltransferase n=1 Tax=Williamsoniiplasma lucivorax TaxID=209274 RepID=A0A2S5RF39_9MOLU|nr:phosphoribosyltransferase family protein [Williamsoniiplasma lucivorax]PPE05908.1 hypoxanthine-guanine phosphoribosyltransferase [Williamsoniiplasma lucivorax]
MMKFRDKLELLITKKQLRDKIRELADSLNTKYKGKELTVICVMNGGLFFYASLLKQLNMKVNVDIISVSHYTNLNFNKGVIFQKKITKPIITGQDVIVIEDLIDTGFTLTAVYEEITFWSPRSIRMITLLDKEGTHPDFKYPYESLFKIPNKFVVGFGLDYNDSYRQLENIYTIED